MKRFCDILLFVTLLVLCACDDFPVTNVKLSDTTLAMKVGETYQIEVIVEPLSSAYANTVSWESSDTNVATVDASGNVTAVYTGECEITAKAGHKTASCLVDVDALTYTFSLPKAKAFYYGDAYKSQSNNITLRLFDNGITVDDTGELSGEGLFLNIDLQVSITEKLVQNGTYLVSSTPLPSTFLPGDTIIRNDTVYATGTYLGQLSDDGFSVIFIKSGSMEVSATGEFYTVNCSFVGEKREQITVSYTGKIPTIDRSGTITPPTPLNLTFIKAESKSLGTKYSSDYNVQCVDLYTQNDKEHLQLELTLPLSIKTYVPKGTYNFSSLTLSSFGIVAPFVALDGTKLGTWLFENGSPIEIVKGYVVVDIQNGTNVFNCQLIDKNGRTIVGKN